MKLIILLVLLFPATALAGGMNDDPLLTKVMVNQLEFQDAGSNSPLAWDAEAWVGKDLNKLWLKTDGEYTNGRVQGAELQALYSRAIAPFWDAQMGWRRDIRPRPGRNWLTLGVKGLAPYYFDIDAAVFIGESGRAAARLKVEYDILFTQRLILTPEIEANIYAKDDPETATGSGLANIETGLRLRYEIRREFAPYIGLNWNRLYGQSADYAREEGAGVDNVRLLIGLRAWY
ncbi:MAG: copper resistance protein B [Deltaproteobacteria bacterium]|nr:copper resistance protein B [Deltaproteobacteria bacterium]